MTDAEMIEMFRAVRGGKAWPSMIAALIVEANALCPHAEGCAFLSPTPTKDTP